MDGKNKKQGGDWITTEIRIVVTWGQGAPKTFDPIAVTTTKLS